MPVDVQNKESLLVSEERCCTWPIVNKVQPVDNKLKKTKGSNIAFFNLDLLKDFLCNFQITMFLLRDSL